jgi:hypothetical protein
MPVTRATSAVESSKSGSIAVLYVPHGITGGEDPCGLDAGVIKYAWLLLLHGNKVKRETHKGDVEKEKKDAFGLPAASEEGASAHGETPAARATLRRRGKTRFSLPAAWEDGTSAHNEV